MTRYGNFIPSITSDFWTEKFRPKDLIKTMAYIHSVLSAKTDLKMIESYDIQYIPDSTLGYTRTWIQIRITDEMYAVEENDVFPWKYKINTAELEKPDTNWISIDAIYTSHVDPEHQYQHDIDFVYSAGYLYFAKKIDLNNIFYISKGQYAGYRLQKEIGTLLGYKRKDSAFYRDSIAPVMAAFYNGPTYENLLALLNVCFNIPVVKYGNEEVLSIENRFITTTKYIYYIPYGNITVKIGDVLQRFGVFTDAITLMTDITHPKWWETKHLDLFKKYLLKSDLSGSALVDDATKNYIVEEYLHDVLLHIYIDSSLVTNDIFIENADLFNLFYDALPTRTDVIMGQHTNAIDWFNKAIDYPTIPKGFPENDPWHNFKDRRIEDLNIDTIGLKVHVKNVYGLDNTAGNYAIYSPSLGRPFFTEDSENPLSFSLNDYKWHIFDKNDNSNYKEFWKDKPDRVPYVELSYSKIYLRETDYAGLKLKTTVKSNYTYLDSRADFTVDKIQLEYGGGINELIPSRFSTENKKTTINANIPKGFVSCIDSLKTADGTPIKLTVSPMKPPLQIAPSHRYRVDRLSEWERSSAIIVTERSMQIGMGEGTLTSEVIQVGKIPKEVVVSTEFCASCGYSDSSTKSSVSLSIQYSAWEVNQTTNKKEAVNKIFNKTYDSSNMRSIGSFSLLNVVGTLKVTYTLKGTARYYPELYSVTIDIKA